MAIKAASELKSSTPTDLQVGIFVDLYYELDRSYVGLPGLPGFKYYRITLKQKLSCWPSVFGYHLVFRARLSLMSTSWNCETMPNTPIGGIKRSNSAIRTGYIWDLASRTFNVVLVHGPLVRSVFEAVGWCA